jgi:hypothetical protein
MRVFISNDQNRLLGKPSFDKRSIFAGLIIWAVALGLFSLVFGYSYLHRSASAEGDVGTLLFIGFFVAIVIFMGGAMSMVLGLVGFLLRLWSFNRRQGASAEIN